jgi:hypothetical protein
MGPVGGAAFYVFFEIASISAAHIGVCVQSSVELTTGRFQAIWSWRKLVAAFAQHLATAL